VIVISSELSELLTACDRILVMADGRAHQMLDRADLDDPGRDRPRTRPAGRRAPVADRNPESPQHKGGQPWLRPSSAPAGGFFANWRQNIIYIGFVVIFLIFALTLNDKGFLNPNNLLNIVRQTAMIAVMAVAMTFVLSAGEIDLSVGAVAGLATVTVAMAIAVAGPLGGILAGLATGFAVGMFNGWLTTRIGIPSFLTTLAMMGIAKGVAMWISDTAAVPILSPLFLDLRRRFGRPDPGPAVLDGLIAGVGHIALRRSGFGRRVLATGGGEMAARYSGIDTAVDQVPGAGPVLLRGGFAGMLYAGRLQSGRFQLGEGDELSVIAAAVLGGTSLFGGKGTVIGTIVGALMIGLINNGLILMGLEFSQQLIARGGIIILAVALSQKRSLSHVYDHRNRHRPPRNPRGTGNVC
jgi:ribose transport system permease protein